MTLEVEGLTKQSDFSSSYKMNLTFSIVCMNIIKPYMYYSLARLAGVRSRCFVHNGSSFAFTYSVGISICQHVLNKFTCLFTLFSSLAVTSYPMSEQCKTYFCECLLHYFWLIVTNLYVELSAQFQRADNCKLFDNILFHDRRSPDLILLVIPNNGSWS